MSDIMVMAGGAALGLGIGATIFALVIVVLVGLLEGKE